MSEPTPFGWKQLIEKTAEKPPNTSLVEIMPLITNKEAALDLGAGPLTDAKFLLNEGFQRVVAVDGESTTQEIANKLNDQRLEIVISSFEDFSFPEGTYDLVNAHRSLFFISPGAFPNVLKGTLNSLKPGGFFVGQLLAPNDGWNKRSDINFHTEEEVRTLFAHMEDIDIREIERDGVLAQGTPKHWHYYEIRARKGSNVVP